jgi:cell surface protein SprA
MKHRLILLFVLIFFAANFLIAGNDNRWLPGISPIWQEWSQALDTTPFSNLKNILTKDKKNPMDLKDPKIIESKIEYDPITNRYIFTKKLGDDYYSAPTYMTFSEYLTWKNKQQDQDYFDRLAGNSAALGDRSNKVDPISKIDFTNSQDSRIKQLLDKNNPGKINPFGKIDLGSKMVDQIFGGTNIDIRPQGSIDVTLGYDYNRFDNPITPVDFRSTGGLLFEQNIQMNVTGKIGEKLNLNTAFNNRATFDADAYAMKLNYNSNQFSEDDIIKSIEAGNVSLPLKNSLIQGAQSLFGLKTELQFGYLKLTLLASQQRSKKKSLTIQGGGQVQQFAVTADQYEENRHYFISQFNRNIFERSLKNLPQINSLFTITDVDVWIVNDRNETKDIRSVVAFSDLGEFDKLTNPNITKPPLAPHYDILNQFPLPDNRANDLFASLTTNKNTRKTQNITNELISSPFALQQTRDYVKFQGRRLDRDKDYFINPELGFISINQNLNASQVLGIAFRYTYNGKLYQVGELFNDATKDNSLDSSDNVIFLKMLKTTTLATNIPLWDLMMKNVYSLGAYQVDQKDFRFDIFYQDPGGGEKRFLPEPCLEKSPLLRLYNLDNLNQQGDPHPDGQFDFVPGLTINPRNGRVIFPVLEPFGRRLNDTILSLCGSQDIANKYKYNELYDSTQFRAQEYPERNRFVMRGSYKSSISSDISLGAFNLPRGSVKVTAGGASLREGIDYDIDYNIGRVKILNDAYLQSGAPINISFEDQTLFGIQTKTMLAARADYQVRKNFNLGFTYMNVFEQPITQKVNFGDDPINNTIYGFDLNYQHEAPWITKFIDKIPLIQTKEPSEIRVTAESAILVPGYSKALNSVDDGGSVFIDDFEGSTSQYDIRFPLNAWAMASIPQDLKLFPESKLVDNINAGNNRALLNWYFIDQSLQRDTKITLDAYTKTYEIKDLFPARSGNNNQNPLLRTLDLAYYPEERGPYNFETPTGTSISKGMSITDGKLNLPETRWGGIMRSLQNNDFESANIEYIDFWMLDPFLDNKIEDNDGKIYINLGNISEDILRDSRLSFENGLPTTNQNSGFVKTNLAHTPRFTTSITPAFNNDPIERGEQDVGFDGLNDVGERTQFADYLKKLKDQNLLNTEYNKIEADPANDNFKFFNNADYPAGTDILTRYKRYNNQQGNSAAATDNTIEANNNQPDTEDLFKDNSLNESEEYFQYELPISRIQKSGVGQKLNTSLSEYYIETNSTNEWHHFRIPVNKFTSKNGNINDFRSIRYMRMFMKGFKRPLVLRFGTMDLVRNQWRTYRRKQVVDGINLSREDDTKFEVGAVSYEENSSKKPFNYVLPNGVVREQSYGSSVQSVPQNEQALSMKVCGLQKGSIKSVFKSLNLDMRYYTKLKMYMHAESKDFPYPDKKTSTFIRLGNDFEENYYEYEIPLTYSDPSKLPSSGSAVQPTEYSDEVWRKEDAFDFPLALLTRVKEERNLRKEPLNKVFEMVDPANPNNRVKVKGNPNLGLVKGAMIGMANYDDVEHCIELWANELRLNGLDESGGGTAALIRTDMKMADFGNVTLAGNYSSIGYGSIEQKIQQRSREEVIQLDASGTFELGKFFPKTSGIKLPMYAQYSVSQRTPQFDPYDYDLDLKAKLRKITNPTEKETVLQQAITKNTIKSINFTNVRKERGNSQSTPKPWDIENLSATYAFTQNTFSDPIIENEDKKLYRGGLEYNYSKPSKYVKPFKSLIKKDKYFKLLTEFNFNPLPSNINVTTNIDRQFNVTKYRFAGDDPQFNTFYNKRFTWDRNYNLQWDFTESLKFNFTAANKAVIDELDEFDKSGNRVDDQVKKDFIWKNVKDLGRTKNYNHSVNLSYTAPFKYIPYLDFVQVRATYAGTYNWNAAAQNTDSLGNIIQNSQNRQINGEFNFTTLYDKFKYLKKISTPKLTGKPKRSRSPEDIKNGNLTANPNENDKLDDMRSRSDKKSKVDVATSDTSTVLNAKGKKIKKKKVEDGEPSDLERALIRPLLSLRNARLNYAETFANTLPGFMPQSKLLGMQNFNAPGWSFVSGYGQADEAYLRSAANNDWITKSVFLNQQVLRTYSQTLDAKITVEPFNDFRVDLELNKQYSKNHSEFFKDTVLDNISSIVSAVPRDIGSYTTSFYSANTLFIGTDTGSLKKLFNTFEDNRAIISARLGGDNTKPHAIDNGFKQGFGRENIDVLIPAFLAAYTNKDARTVDLNIFNTAPKINWRLSYNGLTKMKWFKERFSSINITHGYKSTLTVNSFQTNLNYDQNNLKKVDTTKFDYYSEFQIPSIAINEFFSPLIGIDLRLKNEMTFRFEYKKNRTLAMDFISAQLLETNASDITIGFGHRLKNVRLPFLSPAYKKPTKKDKEAEKDDIANGRGSSKQPRGNDLQLKFDFSYKDDITINHVLNQGIYVPTRGNLTFKFSPSAEYTINKQLSLRFFIEYSQILPKTSLSFPITRASGGFIIRFALK